MARQSGCGLAGAYVRAGCVELTIDLLVALPGAWEAVQGADAQAASPAPHPLSGRARGAAAADALRAPDVGRVLGALGLEQGAAPPLVAHPAGAGRQASEVQEGERWAADVDPRQEPNDGSRQAAAATGAVGVATSVHVQLLGPVPAEVHTPRVSAVHPQVLLLPPPACGGARGAESRHAAAGRSPLPREWHGQPAAGSGVHDLAACPRSSGGGSCSGAGVAEGDCASSSAEVLLRVVLPGPVHRGQGHGPDAHPGTGVGPGVGNGAGPADEAMRRPVVHARSHGAFLPARVVRCGPAAAARGDTVAGPEEYELILFLALPPRAGVILLELSWGDGPPHIAPLLALECSEASVATELLQVLAALQPPGSPFASGGPAGAKAAIVGANCGLSAEQRQEQINGLILDAGVWARAAAAAEHGVADPPLLHPRQWAVLGTNLLSFALRMGLPNMEAWVAAGLVCMEGELQREGEAAAAAAHLEGGAEQEHHAVLASAECLDAGSRGPDVCSTAAHTAVVASPTADGQDASRDACTAALEAHDVEQVKSPRSRPGPHAHASRAVASSSTMPGQTLAQRRCGVATATATIVSSAAGGGRGDPRACGTTQSVAAAVWLHALLVVVGLQQEAEAEEAAYQAFTAPWYISQERIMQTVDCLGMAVLLFRARDNLWDMGNLPTLLVAVPGLVTALGWLLLPTVAYTRLVLRAKLPRYFAFMAAKLVVLWRGVQLPLPPGHLSYQRGLGMALHQGLFLPAACLLPVRTAVWLSLGKCLPCVATLLMSGAAASLRHAFQKCAVVGLLALITTIFCHTYMRACFVLQRYGSRRRAVGSSGSKID